MMSRWLCLAVAAAVAPAPARAERIRLARGAMVFLGAGGTGVCLLSDSGTRDSPCTYVAGAELTLRPTESSPLRLLGGIRSSLYSNDYHGDTSGPEAYYLTQGRELWLGAAWDVLAVSETRSVEIYMAVGRGLGETEEWGGYPNVGRRLAVTGNDYWVSDFGLDLVHASRNHWFLTARLAWTVVRFAPDQQLMRDLGWQVAPLIPRAEVGIGLHF